MKKIYFTMLACLTMGGCADRMGTIETSRGTYISDGAGSSAVIQTITLKDGTVCAAIIGYRNVALSCDWKH